MEGHVSHVLASRLTSRPKGFSRKALENLVQLRVLKANGHELTIEDIIVWRKPIREEKKPRRLPVNMKYKKIYDYNVRLQVRDSNNTNLKEYIQNMASPKWIYS